MIEYFSNMDTSHFNHILFVFVTHFSLFIDFFFFFFFCNFDLTVEILAHTQEKIRFFYDLSCYGTIYMYMLN